MADVYVYYQVAPQLQAAAAAAVDKVLDALSGLCDAPPQRLVRCDDATTWMEVYPGVADPEAFSRALDNAVTQSGAAEWIRGERHLECFVVA